MGEGVWVRASEAGWKPPPAGRSAGAWVPQRCPGWSSKCPLPDARTLVKDWRAGQGLGQSGHVKDFLDKSCFCDIFPPSDTQLCFTFRLPGKCSSRGSVDPLGHLPVPSSTNIKGRGPEAELRVVLSGLEHTLVR